MNKRNYKEKLNDYGFYTVDPIPSEEEVNKFYEIEFYQNPKITNHDSSLQVRDKDAEYYEFWYKFYIELIPEKIINNKTKLLDLGCGYGHFLNYIKNKTKINNLTGVEPFPDFLKHVEDNGMIGHVSTLEDFSSSSKNKYDIITLLNVLEHLIDPYEILKNIKSNLLNNLGYVIIQVPNDFNIFQKLAVKKNSCDKWWFTPPQHISYFNTKGLKSILNEAGYNNIEMYCNFPIDMYLLTGHDYINYPNLGRDAHKSRFEFEKTFIKYNELESLKEIYRNFANSGIGREIIAIAS